ncbi:carbonic anhydrase [Emcibacter nanhaiensis]|uniref:Carbonic anhydrase n=1 Tax=Emcibacter nanhaiensis TaxID=1505037 RepID=A0A501PNC1_9PROT|nr:carbonic anhydrase [Emcibacter nanhaiensis]TPD61933.1 carbonic anhydrase [Emcibacter nanhaiensis]
MPLRNLIEGHKNFLSGRFQQDKKLYEELVDKGQSPEVMIISCCDSRADPVIITEAEPGSVFSLRNVANLVPPYHPDGNQHSSSAALEFAVRHLKVNDIVIMGHAHCGGIKALYHGDFDNQDHVDFIEPWMSIANEARRNTLRKFDGESEGKILREMEKESIRVSLKNLRTFRWIKAAEQDGSLRLHGWHFEIESGTLYALDEKSGEFSPLV